MTAKNKTVIRKKTRKTGKKVGSVKALDRKKESDENDPDIVYVNGYGKPNGPQGGRPSMAVKLSQIRSLAAIGCTGVEMANVLGMNKGTFVELKKNNPVVVEIIRQGKSEGCASLRRKQHEVAMRGDVQMLKWLGKNRLKQSERILAHTETSQGDSIYKMMREIVDDDESAE